MLRRIFSPSTTLVIVILIGSVTFNIFDHPLSEPLFLQAAAIFVVTLSAILFLGQRGLKDANRGVTMLHQGRYAEALALYEREGKRWVRIATVRHNRAIALLGLWRIEEARALQKAILEHPAAGERTVHFLTKPEYALTSALVGDAEVAREIISESPSTPVLLLASAILAARAGRFEEVEPLVGGREAIHLSGYHRVLAEVVLDWSRLETGKRPSPTNHRERLFGADGSGTLPTHWPELLAAIERLEALGAAPLESGT